jgi:Ala-tRNA(Pro) deacylase
VSQQQHNPVHQRLTDALTLAAVPFSTLSHEPVFTSAAAAEVRGVDLHSGAKALVLKIDDRFIMVVLPADLALDSKAARKALQGKSLRFADQDEVLQITALTPGSIPPFGSLFDLPTYCDERLADNESINFNAAAHDISISMTYAAYAAYENPTVGRFGKPPA